MSNTLEELESRIKAAANGLRNSPEAIDTLRAEVQLQEWRDKATKWHEADAAESLNVLTERENQLVNLQSHVEAVNVELAKKKFIARG